LLVYVRAVLHVDLDTRLSSLAQRSRTGRRYAQFASHSAGGAAWAGPRTLAAPPVCAAWRWAPARRGSRSGGPITSRSEVTRTPNGSGAVWAWAPELPAGATTTAATWHHDSSPARPLAGQSFRLRVLCDCDRWSWRGTWHCQPAPAASPANLAVGRSYHRLTR